jgi:rfaE bifunctional protein kinase chain/domain
MKIKPKILLFDELVGKVARLRAKGKVVVQSHGIFDLVHPGVVAHLESARRQGDVLVVTVIMDRHVRKGPGRPIFPENLRAQNVASLEQVDYVSVVEDEVPFECVKSVNPDVFAKGEAFKDRDRIVDEKIFKEEKEFYFGDTRVHETDGFSFSSTRIINRFLDIYPDETKAFLRRFSGKYGFDRIKKQIDGLKDMKVLIIGDGIIDEYHYCHPMSKSAKSQLIVNRYLDHDVFAGGAFAIANHVAGLCDRVHLVTLLGGEDTREDFVTDNLMQNVTTKFFYRDDGPTVIKKRYINQYLNQKLFEINYLNDSYINKDFEARIVRYLNKTIPGYDLVLVSDFGHGFITERIIKRLRKLSKTLAINTQTNGANAGYNLITKYDRPDFVCLDEPEVRLATQGKYDDIEKLARSIARSINAGNFIVTLGKKGSIGVDDNKGVVRTPIFSSKVIDTVGAGDAFFSFTAPCFARGMPLELISFVGNAVGALAVQIVGNKKPVEKAEFLSFVSAILK